MVLPAPTFRFRVDIDEGESLEIVIEPSGMVVEIDHSDYLTVELPVAPGVMDTVISHSPGRLTISEPGGDGVARVWNSSGEQIW
ncbi:hypothetical protein ACFYS8_17805 [Kitasatospora sp. NPDC004615]|uniref:hypothetical protein n=1 Tax=Kitasatospora sp. NPDC004615 TaxID=3364017 RepID=UPI0036A509A1